VCKGTRFFGTDKIIGLIFSRVTLFHMGLAPVAAFSRVFSETDAASGGGGVVFRANFRIFAGALAAAPYTAAPYGAKSI